MGPMPIGSTALRAAVGRTNGTSFVVSLLLTNTYVSASGNPYRPALRGLGLFRLLQRLRHRWAAKDEVASDAERVTTIEFTPYGSAIRRSNRSAQRGLLATRRSERAARGRGVPGSRLQRDAGRQQEMPPRISKGMHM